MRTYFKEHIENKVEIHDHTQFEVKLDYHQNLKSRINKYKVEAYLFMPKSLGITPQRYTKDIFYNDLFTYLRQGTPLISLKKLVEQGSSCSIQQRIGRQIERIHSGTQKEGDYEAIDYEVRLFACIFRGQIRNQISFLKEQFLKIKAQPNELSTLCKEMRVLMKQLLQDSSNALEIFRAQRALFSNPATPPQLLEIFDNANEFMSIVLETNFSELLIKINQNEELKEILQKISSKYMQVIVNEYEYRSGLGYKTADPNDYDGETYNIRRSYLKKNIMEVLFLNTRLEQDGKKTTNFLASTAAGLAMLWAVSATIIGQRAFVTNSIPFIIAMVLAYIVKDRIKEWLKSYFNRSVVSRFFHDYRVKIYDPFRKKWIGNSRENFLFIDHESIPQDIRNIRWNNKKSEKNENVIKYEKEVILFTKRIGKSHKRLRRLSEIIRLNISSFLSRMDNPSVYVSRYNPHLRGVGKIRASKVYPIHLILNLTSLDKQDGLHSVIDGYRIILNKHGIVRLESLMYHDQIHSEPIFQESDLVQSSQDFDPNDNYDDEVLEQDQKQPKISVAM